jgi:cytochrome o ubiquinol oxidase operon protein cyoD
MKIRLTFKPDAASEKYIVGFGLSLVITIVAYLVVQIHLRSGHVVPSDSNLILILAALAIAQLFAQLVFFLHLNREPRPRLNTLIMMFAALVVVIIVGGSIWIMNNLNYHNMTPDQTNTFIIKDEGVKH